MELREAEEFLLSHGWTVKPPPQYISQIRRIQDETCYKYGFTRLELLSRRRYTTLVRCRHEAIRRCFLETCASFPELGRAFNRDHTSIMYAVGNLMRKPLTEPPDKEREDR
ncbi:hypothetical protein LCGC14_0354760 [marine sediment metagenome]|uniref:Chromosomal replication initiator DnaA C-terminal domain-containing protein n=1 Tax=marine sediment metagenome TaxID=412755 RepID=A0A0F9VWS8_9ZZZZ